MILWLFLKPPKKKPQPSLESLAFQDPFADALGGIPPGIFGFVDKELDSFKEFPGLLIDSFGL